MIIKSLTISDIDQNKDVMCELIYSCLEESYKISELNTFVSSKFLSLKHHLKENEAKVLGAFEDSELIGFAWFYPLKTVDAEVYHIAYISVLPLNRGKGVGTSLLKAVEDFAREEGVRKLELVVSYSNEDAISVYEKNDYGIERVIMTKIIDN